MSLQPFISVLVIVLIGTAAVMWQAARLDSGWLFALAAVVFAVSAMGAGVAINQPLWNSSPTAALQEQAHALRRNGRLAVLTYLWGAIVMTLVYAFSGLSWQHGLQYAAGMALLAGLVFAYVYFCREGSRLREQQTLDAAMWLSALQGLAAAGGLVFLLASGKLFLGKSDWAANIVFLSGGVVIVALNALAVITHHRLGRLADPQR